MNKRTHYNASVYVNGNLLTEESNVTVKRESGGNAVKTVAKGYAGRSPGAPTTTITVKNAVPSLEFELNPGQYINNNESVEISIFADGRTLTIDGHISNDNFDECAKGTDTALQFEFNGGASDWTA